MELISKKEDEKRLRLNPKALIFFFCFLIFLTISSQLASAADVAVWQGQYYTGSKFNVGTYTFNFTVYDALSGGKPCYSSVSNITTGIFGQWITEQEGVSTACTNISKDYFLNININGIDQTPRRRLVIWNPLRKNVHEVSTGSLTVESHITTPIVNATQSVVAQNISAKNGIFSYLGNLVNHINKIFVGDLEFSGDINGTGNIDTIGNISSGSRIQGHYYSSDSSEGITNTTGYWLCTSDKCKTFCQVQIKNGIITGCI